MKTSLNFYFTALFLSGEIRNDDGDKFQVRQLLTILTRHEMAYTVACFTKGTQKHGLTSLLNNQFVINMTGLYWNSYDSISYIFSFT